MAPHTKNILAEVPIQCGIFKFVVWSSPSLRNLNLNWWITILSYLKKRYRKCKWHLVRSDFGLKVSQLCGQMWPIPFLSAKHLVLYLDWNQCVRKKHCIGIKGTVSPCNKLIPGKRVKNYNIHENRDCILIYPSRNRMIWIPEIGVQCYALIDAMFIETM